MAVPERRRIQRVKLSTPMTGRLSGMRVSIIDLSTTGARVEHSFPLAAGRRLRLEFPWQDESISLQCDVVRCLVQRDDGLGTREAYSSGLKFCEPPGPSRTSLVRVITELVSRQLVTLRDQLLHA